MRRRDRNILRDISHGLTVAEVARRRGIHRRTVERVVAVARARHAGLGG
jgi:DNA-binding NarL/FixJ family response regulator